MPDEVIEEVSVKIPMPADLRERWEKFVFNRGYGKGPFLRTFIEAVTDPVRGPQVERAIQKRAPFPEAQP